MFIFGGVILYFAYTKNQKKVQAKDAIRSQSYFCLCCQLPVFIRTSKRHKRHFVHYQMKEEMKYNNELHQNIVAELAQKMRILTEEVKREKKLSPDVRVDIYVKYQKKKYALEVQKSALSEQNILRKYHKYRKHLDALIWIIPLNNLAIFQQQYVTKKTAILSMAINLMMHNQKIMLYHGGNYFCLNNIYQISSQKVALCYEKCRNELDFFRLQKKLIINDNQLRTFFLQWKKNFTIKRFDLNNSLQQLLYRLQIPVSEIDARILDGKYTFLMVKKDFFWVQTYLFILFAFCDYSTLDAVYELDKQNLLRSIPRSMVYNEILLYHKKITSLNY